MLPSLTLQDANKGPCMCVLVHDWVCAELSCTLSTFSPHLFSVLCLLWQVIEHCPFHALLAPDFSNLKLCQNHYGDPCIIFLKWFHVYNLLFYHVLSLQSDEFIYLLCQAADWSWRAVETCPRPASRSPGTWRWVSPRCVQFPSPLPAVIYGWPQRSRLLNGKAESSLCLGCTAIN